MQPEDVHLGLLVWHRELDLSIDPSWSDQRRVEALDPVCGHNDLDVVSGVEAIELIKQLQKRPLNLPFTARRRVVSLRADRVDLVDEDDARRVLFSHSEQLSDELGAVTEILLDQL